MTEPPASLVGVHYKLNTDLSYFAQHAPLLIKDKEGALIRWVPNRAQLYIHSRLEEQFKRTGRIRALILKGRQQGCSTYVAARFYWKMTRKPGTSTLILSHEGKSSDKLFDMAKRFQENVNPALRPEEGKSNTRQLVFSKLNSDYAVGTAGNENVGRGSTAQLFHGSEIAYWDHAAAIQDGALESIGDVPGTEIILESTANGPIGLFYDKSMQALSGVGDYILVFCPWFWTEDYERVAPPHKELIEEETAFVLTYLKEFPYPKALRKIAWRRAKIIDLSTGDNTASGEAKFRQIYPSNPVEAFQASGVGLIRPDAIMAARKSTLTDEVSPLIVGVDPAGDSDSSDRTIIALRRGRHLEEIIKYARMRPMELAGILAKIIDTRQVDMCFIDRGYGEGTIDRLRELGYGRRVQGIAFNERPLNPDIYLNKRSEIIIETAMWINAGGVRIPDDDDIHADFSSVPLDEETSNGLKFIKSKREIKKILGRSPDIFDAVALTFSYPVRRDFQSSGGFRKATPGEIGKKVVSSALKSMGRIRGRKGR